MITRQRVKLADGTVTERVLIATRMPDGTIRVHSVDPERQRGLIQQLADLDADVKLIDYNRKLGTKDEDDDEDIDEETGLFEDEVAP